MKKKNNIFNKHLINCVNSAIKTIIPENSRLYRSLYFAGFSLFQGTRLKRRTLLRFDVHLVDHCNLNCAGCDNFSPLAEKFFLDIKAFERDIARLSILTQGQIEDICLLGGEPLLHPQIIDFLEISRKYFKNGTINIVTNGILLLKLPDLFWQSCVKNNIHIIITKYPVKILLQEIKETANKYGVSLEILYENSSRGFYKRPLDLHGHGGSISDNFKFCFYSNRCIYLKDGRLMCATVANIDHFNKYFNQNLEVTEKDSIDIFKAKTIDEILDFCCKPVPFCKYCNVRKTVFGLDWAVSKKEISEWT